MSLEIEPEVGVPFSDKVPSIDLRTRVEAASNTASMLAEHGLEVEPTAEDNNIAAKLTLAYADDPEKTSTTRRIGGNTRDFDPVRPFSG